MGLYSCPTTNSKCRFCLIFFLLLAAPLNFLYLPTYYNVPGSKRTQNARFVYIQEQPLDGKSVKHGTYSQAAWQNLEVHLGSHGNNGKAINELLWKGRHFNLTLHPPADNSLVNTIVYHDLGRYIDYLSIFEETITLEALPQCLTVIEKKLPGSSFEISKGIVQCDAAFQRRIGDIAVFNVEELRKFMQLRGNVTHMESHTGYSSLLTYIKPVLRVVKSESLRDPPQVSFESWNSCMARSSLPCVLEELHGTKRKDWKHLIDREDGKSHPKISFATITMPLAYSHPRRIENIETMKKTVPNLRVYDGYHGNNETAIGNLVRISRTFNLTVAHKYADHVAKYVTVGKLGHWASFLTVFKDALNTPKGKVPDCVLLVEDDFWFRMEDYSNVEEGCRELLKDGNTIFYRMSRFDSANLLNVKLLHRIFEAIAENGISDPFDNFTIKRRMLRTRKRSLKHSHRIKLHSTLWTQPGFYVDSWNKCILGSCKSLRFTHNRKDYDVPIRSHS